MNELNESNEMAEFMAELKKDPNAVAVEGQYRDIEDTSIVLNRVITHFFTREGGKKDIVFDKPAEGVDALQERLWLLVREALGTKPRKVG